MYLSRRTYVKNWDHMTPEEKHNITIKRGGKPVKDIKPERISYITEQVMYWRKANAIHNWFVEKVQEGVDDCKEYDVSKEQLQSLLDIIKSILRGEAKPEDVLPAQEGFFFGSTEYDEWYFKDLEETRDVLEALLKEDTRGYYSYQSSW